MPHDQKFANGQCLHSLTASNRHAASIEGVKVYHELNHIRPKPGLPNSSIAIYDFRTLVIRHPWEFHTETEVKDLQNQERQRLYVPETEGQPNHPGVEGAAADDVHYDISQFGLDRTTACPSEDQLQSELNMP